MNPIFAAAVELSRACEAAGFRFCIIGGVAVQRFGEPRLTQDVDVTLFTGFGNEKPFIDALLQGFRGRMNEAADFALANRVLLLRASNGTPLDIALGAMPFEERTIDRSSLFAIAPEASLRTCSAEDLIVHKAFASRDKDWLDIKGIVERQGTKLDRALVWQELRPLLELREGSNAEARLAAIFT